MVTLPDFIFGLFLLFMVMVFLTLVITGVNTFIDYILVKCGLIKLPTTSKVSFGIAITAMYVLYVLNASGIT